MIFFLVPTHLQKKVLLQAGNDGEISVIDVVPIETANVSGGSPITVSLAPQPTPENAQQVTAQVAVVQAQNSSESTPHYITVTGNHHFIL